MPSRGKKIKDPDKSFWGWVVKNALIPILVAVIGAYAVLVAAKIPPFYSPTFVTATPIPSETFTAVVPTDTPFPPTQPSTDTPLPTDTPIPTNTPLPSPTIDPAQFRGFDKNCIDQKYWSVSVLHGQSEPSVYGQNSNACYDLSSDGLNLQNQSLIFNALSLSSAVFGMYTPLANVDTDINFNFRIHTFTLSNNATADGIITFGISDPQDSNFKNGNYLSYSIIHNTYSNNIYVDIGTSKTNPAFAWIHPFAVSNTDYHITFSIRGVSLYVYINGETSSYYPRSLSQLSGHGVFWIGYQLPVGKTSLDAYITNFLIVNK